MTSEFPQELIDQYSTSRINRNKYPAPADSNAERRYQGLPIHVKDMACTCEESQPVTYGILGAGIKAPIGAFCLLCDKPTRYTLVEALVECEGCENLYVPFPRRESYPLPRVRLCGPCNSRVPTRRRVVKSRD